MGRNDDRSDPWNRETKPDHRPDIHYRHGLLMREVAELRERVEALETLNDEMHRRRGSIRPTVERVSVSAVVAGIVAALVQLAQLIR